MNNVDSFLSEIRRMAEQLLRGENDENEFVIRFTRMMADELPDELNNGNVFYELLDEYCYSFAFFQRDPKIRAEEPKFLYGSERLHREVTNLLRGLDELTGLQSANRVDSFLAEIRSTLEAYLRGDISAKACSNRFEDLMADERPEELGRGNAYYELLEEFYYSLGFFQNDRAILEGLPDDFFGPEELKEKSRGLLAGLDRLSDAE